MKKKLFTILLALTVVLSMSFSAVPTFAADMGAAASAGIPISSIDDLRKIEQNPSGNYYLTKDIDVRDIGSICPQEKKFTGTLDGKGHALKGYYTILARWNDYGIFKNAEGATFKNLNITGVDISIMSDEGSRVGVLVNSASKCKFDNIKTTGKIVAKGTQRENKNQTFSLGGIAVLDNGCTFNKCRNYINFTVTPSSEVWVPQDIGVYGISGGQYNTTFTNCTNYGNISVSTPKGTYGVSAAGIAGGGTFKTCTNKGKVTVKTIGSNGAVHTNVGGVAAKAEKLNGCTNSGTITASLTGEKTNYTSEVNVGGVAGSCSYVNRTDNTGAVYYYGKAYKAHVGGVVGFGSSFKECYNKGAVKANASESKYELHVGGLVGSLKSGVKCGIQQCYNTGSVYSKKAGNIGGIMGNMDTMGSFTYSNYNTGKVTCGVTCYSKGSIVGFYDYDYLDLKCKLYNCYYTSSAKGFGSGSPNNYYKTEPQRIKKVSKITKANCPKLTSTYWTYSSKKGRMILKNNKEA